MVRHEEDVGHGGGIQRGQLARDLDVGGFETGERVLDPDGHWSGRVAESAELLAFGEDFASG